MTVPLSEFADIANKHFKVDAAKKQDGICSPLRLERGTRSFATTLVGAGFVSLGDLDGKTVMEIVKDKETTRPVTTRHNLDKALKYLEAAGVTLG